MLIGVGMQTALYGGSITLMSKFNEDQSEFIATWFAGNIWGDDFTFVIATIPWLIIIIPFLLYKSNVLNLINTHEHIAKGLGVKIERERVILFFIAVVLSSIAVAVAGAITFIGLMGPHCKINYWTASSTTFTNFNYCRCLLTCFIRYHW